jgi:succinate dehydrogenase / fumarate reductase cytochrome b subunit
MATTVIKEGQPGNRARFRDSFVLHKLMSLTGIFPIGFFMIQHLIANSYSLRGRTEFNTVVSVFGYLPFVAILEWAIVFIPIIFHAIYGLFIVAEMQGPNGNTAYYGYTRNWLYVLQRWTGVIALLYIAVHTVDTWGIKKLFELQQSHEAGFRAISYDAMMWRFGSPLYTLMYVVGITAASFHLGNGLFNFCIRWGITIGDKAQKVSAILWSGVGFALAFIGIWTSLNFYVLAHRPYVDSNGKTYGYSIREVYKDVDDVVKNLPSAPAAPIPGAKPVEGPGGVVGDPSASSGAESTTPAATAP